MLLLLWFLPSNLFADEGERTYSRMPSSATPTLVPLGLMHVEEMLDDEVTALAGARYAHRRDVTPTWETFAEATMVIALGITMTGEKRFGLPLRNRHGERAGVDVLDDISQGVLVILDGSKGLRAAVRKAFRRRAVVQRCQWHKRENVVSYLAKTEQPLWRQRLLAQAAAWRRPQSD